MPNRDQLFTRDQLCSREEYMKRVSKWEGPTATHDFAVLLGKNICGDMVYQPYLNDLPYGEPLVVRSYSNHQRKVKEVCKYAPQMGIFFVYSYDGWSLKPCRHKKEKA